MTSDSDDMDLSKAREANRRKRRERTCELAATSRALAWLLTETICRSKTVPCLVGRLAMGEGEAKHSQAAALAET